MRADRDLDQVALKREEPEYPVRKRGEYSGELSRRSHESFIFAYCADHPSAVLLPPGLRRTTTAAQLSDFGFAAGLTIPDYGSIQVRPSPRSPTRGVRFLCQKAAAPSLLEFRCA